MSLTAALAAVEARYAAGEHLAHRHALRQYAPLIHRAVPEQQATWAAWMGFLHSVTGSKPQMVLQYCQRSIRIAAAHRLTQVQAFATACLAQQHYIMGDLVTAAGTGRQALRMLLEQDDHAGAARDRPVAVHLAEIAGLGIAQRLGGAGERFLRL